MMRRIDLILAALVGVAGVVAYVAYPYLKGSPPVQTASAGAVSQSAPSLVQTAPAMPSLERSATSALEEPTAQAARSEAPPAAAPPVAVPRAHEGVSPRAAPARAKTNPAAPRPQYAAPAPQRPPYAVTTAFGGDVFGTPAAQPPSRIAAAAVPAPARKDRLQQMNDTIAGCASEGFFGRIACEQRALLAYCDGQWGRNERCPSGRTADYGN